MAKRKLHTRLCDVLEIEYPIIQAGMGGFSDPPLVIAVSEAGGLGTLGAAVYEPDTLDEAIKEIRKGTSKPYAIDLLLPDSLKDMEGISKEGLMKYIPDDYWEYEKELRKKFDIPDDYRNTRGSAQMTAEGTKQLIQVCMDNEVAVLADRVGRLGWLMPECKQRGIKTIGIGANVKMALKHVEDEVDVIVAQGFDAGGHTGNIGTLAVVPQIVDAVKPIPVAAAGGIADARGLVAALALGAEGVWCGSMFLLSPEATFTELQKDKVIAATDVPEQNVGHIDHNSYNKDNETNWLNWDHKRANGNLVDYYSKLIALRRQLPALRHADSENIEFIDVRDKVAVAWYLADSLAVLLNGASTIPLTITLRPGDWTILVDDADVYPAGSTITNGELEVPPTSGIVLSRR